jgi:hypothetical protein
MDGGTISVFSHSTGTSYEKNENAKNKILKLQGAIKYLTLIFNNRKGTTVI